MIKSIHPSSIKRWARCEASAIHYMQDIHSKDREKHAPHVASYVGSAVHAKVAQVEHPPAPLFIKYDKETPTMKVANKQTEKLSMLAIEKLRELRLFIADSEVDFDFQINEAVEVRGRVDAIVEIQLTGELCLLEIKCKEPDPTDLHQIGAYALFMRKESPNLKHYCILYLPRTITSLEEVVVVKGEIDKIKEPAFNMMKRIVHVLSSVDEETYTPGYHCAKCALEECHMRIN